MIPAREIAAALHLRPVPLRREWRGDCPSCGYAGRLVLAEKDGPKLLATLRSGGRPHLIRLAHLTGAGTRRTD